MVREDMECEETAGKAIYVGREADDVGGECVEEEEEVVVGVEVYLC